MLVLTLTVYLLLLPLSSGQNVIDSFGIPSGCERSACTVYAQWSSVPSDSSVLMFELEGSAMGWVAMGLSADQVMGGNGIDDVFVCQRNTGNNNVFAKDTFNPQSPRSNNIDSNQNGLVMISSSFSGGRISCSFTRTIEAGNAGQDRRLDESVFILLAAGSERGGATVGLSVRHDVTRGSTAAALSLLPPEVSSVSPEGTATTDMIAPSSPAAPPPSSAPSMSPTPTATPTLEIQSLGSFGIPSGCERSVCTVYAQWSSVPSDSSVLFFELEGSAMSLGWVAMGLSADRVMGGNGIDDVFVCQRDTGNNDVFAKDTFNPQSPRSNNIDSNQNGLVMISSSFSGGRISCSFTRTIEAGNPGQDRRLNESVFILLAAGSERGAANVGLTLRHDIIREAAAGAVVLTEGGSPEGGCADNPLVRVHGILMYIAWGILVPIAYFFAANMRPAMPTGLWFQFHRALMLIAIIPSVIGFILIFVHFRNDAGLISFGPENPVGSAHLVIGVVVIFLQFLNPIISFARCKPTSSKRVIFNWIHGYIVGYGVILLALVNITLGLWLYGSRHTQNQFSAFWLWIAVLIIFSIWDSLTFLYSKFYWPWRQKEDKKENGGTEMTEKSDLSKNSDEKPKKKPSKDAPLRYISLGLTIGFLAVFGLIIIILVAIGCF